MHPGTGDLTLKIKDVDLEKFHLLHDELNFPKKNKRCGKEPLYKPPRLKHKIENDRYCSEGRATYEAMYRPVKLSPPTVRDYKCAERCFPGIWDFFGLDPSGVLELPEYNRRSFSKSVWDIKVAGVPGVANWVVSYPTLLDALTGGAILNTECELSFRVKRLCAESIGEEDALKEALIAAAGVSQAMHNAGWDTGVH